MVSKLEINNTGKSIVHWHFVPNDASPLLRRRPFPLVSPRTAQEAP